MRLLGKLRRQAFRGRLGGDLRTSWRAVVRWQSRAVNPSGRLVVGVSLGELVRKLVGEALCGQRRRACWDVRGVFTLFRLLSRGGCSALTIGECRFFGDAQQLLRVA